MRKYFVIFAALLLAASVQAQSFQQAFFLDGYRLGYRYNPALQNQDSFLSIGQYESQVRNNFGAASFLYPRGNEVVTAFHSTVSAQEFLGSLQDRNYFNGSISYNLVSYGWRKDAAYHTLEVNARAFYMASIPKDIFSILKLGTGAVNYSLGGLGVGGNALVEVAYGYSRQLSDKISVGARVKLLAGIDALNYQVTRFDLTLSEDEYRAQIAADLDLTSRWNKMQTDEEGYLSLLSLSFKDRWKLPSGAGLALDLGVVVTPFEGLSLSASIVDLGGMFWYYGNAGRSWGITHFTGMEDLSLEEIQKGNIKDQFSDELETLLGSLKIKPGSRKALGLIPFNVNLAARYELPFYKPLSIGATGNYINMKGMDYMEARGVLAWNPWEWLGVTANAGAGTLGAVWGAALNAGYRNFRITVGYSDGFGGTIPYTSTPLKPNNKMVTFGLTYDL